MFSFITLYNMILHGYNNVFKEIIKSYLGLFTKNEQQCSLAVLSDLEHQFFFSTFFLPNF